MRLALSFTWLVLLMLPGCDSGETASRHRDAEIANLRHQITSQLEWVDTADPKAMARHDIAQKRYRFFSVCGYACGIVGIGGLDAQRCFPAAHEERIKGGTDAPVSDEHSRLIGKAFAFAAEYNAYVARYLVDHAQRQCSPDWNGAANALANFARSHQAQLSVRLNRPVFLVTLQPNVPAQDVLPTLCGIVRSHGLAFDATLAIRKAGQSENRAQTVSCATDGYPELG